MLTIAQLLRDMTTLRILFASEPLSPERMALYCDILRPVFATDPAGWRDVCNRLMRTCLPTYAERFPLPAHCLAGMTPPAHTEE